MTDYSQMQEAFEQIEAGLGQEVPADPARYRAIVSLALPLVLAMTAQTLMFFVDGLFLAWHSTEAIAAVGFAGMAVWLVTSFFYGAAGYTSTFAAQYQGAGRFERVSVAVWQGVFLAAGSGALVALAAAFVRPVFAMAGHGPEILELELTYFRVSCWGAPFGLVSAAVAGYFSGLGRTRILMAVQLGGVALNALLDYLLIFGRFGAPELGVAGAALATAIAQFAGAVVLLGLFLRRREHESHRTRSVRFDALILRRLLQFGLPNGLRFSIEGIGWTAFMLFVGRTGPAALAATSIAMRINSIAFFPLIGLSSAVGIVVGQAQGAGNPDLSARVTRRGAILGEGWMLLAATAFVLFPGFFVGLFMPAGGGEEHAEVAAVAAGLLLFVAVYCVLDGLNVILLGSLQAAGDTRWTLGATIAMFGIFVGSLAALDALGAGLHAEWTAMTIFVVALALVWLWRFLGGRWRGMRVIGEETVAALPPSVLEDASAALPEEI